MGYHILDPDTIESTSEYPCDRRSISEASDLSTLAASIYTVDPGERLARTYHYHEQREEVFYVISGTLSVQTPDETLKIGQDTVFVVEPESPFLPHVPESAQEAARVFGIGAPRYDAGRSYEPTDTKPE